MTFDVLLRYMMLPNILLIIGLFQQYHCAIANEKHEEFGSRMYSECPL